MEEEIRQQNGEKLIRILMMTLTLSVISAFMFNIVLPQIRDEFDLTTSEVSWMSSAYTLIYAIGSVTYGKLADRYRLKNLLTFGLLLFAFGSLIGLFSQTFGMVLFGRCLQAMGAAVVPATAMLIPVRYFAPERRGAAIGTATVGMALGNALAPVIAAFVVSVTNWRWLFALPLLILLTLPFYRKYLDDEQGRPVKMDWIGGGLLAVTVAMLLLSVTNGTWSFAACGLLTLALFIARTRSADEPFIEPRLFRNRRYTLGLSIVFLVSGIGFSLVFLTPQLLAQVHELPPERIGFAMVPAAIAMALLGKTTGTMADSRGHVYVFYLASGSLIASFGLLSTFTAISPFIIAVFLIFGNVGQSSMLIAMSKSISTTLPKEHTGVGMGIFSLLNFISSAMAAGLYSRMVDLGSDFRLNPVYFYTGGVVFSNIYFVLAALHVAILVFYYFQFGRERERVSGHLVVNRSKQG
ncbi:MFS transporter [Paenibacillus beijingensis]|uniref:Antiporter n=1 Tax=Paenibacillus beijingensis TaxID=1126833 RepID=A0A0D5NP77_9BACL|nr:MFS transporter [Paenibacillus beijingensis]AJY76970.1 antiporter [Paenibacillus beijingensis]